MGQSVHHKKDFTVVSMRVYGSFSNCHWSKHQDFVKGSAYWRVLAVRIVGEDVSSLYRPHAQGREPQKTSGQGRHRVPPACARACQARTSVRGALNLGETRQRTLYRQTVAA